MNELEYQVSGYDENYVNMLVGGVFPRMLDTSTVTGKVPYQCFLQFSLVIYYSSLSILVPQHRGMLRPRIGFFGTKEFMFRMIAGVLVFPYIADDGPNNLPSRVSPTFSQLLSACRF